MFSHRVRELQTQSGDPFLPLAAVTDQLSKSDLTIGNFETPISLSRNNVPGSRPDYWAIPQSADAVRKAGFDLVTLANNHIYDFGSEGVEITIKELARAGVRMCGLEAAGPLCPWSTIVRVKDSRIAVLPYCGMRNVTPRSHTFYTRAPVPSLVRHDVQQIREHCDHVVVVLHDGNGVYPSKELTNAAMAAVDAGAAIIACHHSHELSGIVKEGKSLIAYGLGNFVAATNNFSESRRRGMLLNVDLGKDGVQNWDYIPTYVSEEAKTELASVSKAQEIRKEVESLSASIGEGKSAQLYDASVTGTAIRNRLLEIGKETFRARGRNIMPTLQNLSPRHIEFLRTGARKMVPFYRPTTRGKEKTRLIVNADGFGFTPGVNRAVFDVMDRGFVRSVSANTTFSYISEVRELQSRHPDASVGIHFNLTVGPPALPIDHVPSLVGSNGEFLGRDFFRQALHGKIRMSEIEAELEAQAAVLRDYGIRISHWDSHQGAHLKEPFLTAALKVAKRMEIKCMRSHDLVLPTSSLDNLQKLLSSPRLLVRTGLRKAVLLRAHQAGFQTADHSVALGVVQGTEPHLEQAWSKVLDWLPTGTWEVWCHPGYPDEQLRRYATLVDTRPAEAKALMSPILLEQARRRNIEIISYHEL